MNAVSFQYLVVIVQFECGSCIVGVANNYMAIESAPSHCITGNDDDQVPRQMRIEFVRWRFSSRLKLAGGGFADFVGLTDWLLGDLASGTTQRQPLC